MSRHDDGFMIAASAAIRARNTEYVRGINQCEFKMAYLNAGMNNNNSSILDEYCLERLRTWLKSPFTVHKPGAELPSEFVEVTSGPLPFITVHKDDATHALFITSVLHADSGIMTLLWPIKDSTKDVVGTRIDKNFPIDIHSEESMDIALKEIADYAREML